MTAVRNLSARWVEVTHDQNGIEVAPGQWAVRIALSAGDGVGVQWFDLPESMAEHFAEMLGDRGIKKFEVTAL